MPADTSEKQGFFSRSVPLKWVVVMAATLVVIMAAVVVAVLLVDRSRDAAGDESAQETGAPAEVVSPYDLVELPADVKLDRIEGAAFVSLFLPDETGVITSYGVSSDLPATQALIAAIREADRVGADEAAAALGARAANSTMTFVLPTRDTITFALYLDEGMIARGADAWRPKGDLKALVEAATAGP